MKNEKNRMIAIKLLMYSKYSGIISASSLVLFLIINAFNTGNDILFWLSYALVIITIWGLLQWLFLRIIGSYYFRKSSR